MRVVGGWSTRVIWKKRITLRNINLKKSQTFGPSDTDLKKLSGDCFVGALPLYEMGPKMGQLCGMQATVQLHRMARNSIFKKFTFWLFN